MAAPPSNNKKLQAPERYRPRRWFDPNLRYWFILEPARLGMVGGAVAAVGTLTYLYIRQQMGLVMEPSYVLFRIALAFVVSYALTGLFVYYLVWVADRELNAAPAPAPSPLPEEPGEEGFESAEEDGSSPSESEEAQP